ncbi:hypothetical protein BP6252_10305 [Coleophoma cylindrospora]|uniref:ABC transporter TMD0 domain-containing protein n=1 Tax=Coleophoma cylindrospora TaxID=1849047 RepID=A0A3D8QT17_9HELO|nr:hypothetical protein BP6252_10305 [Coleophoma cylindrospora]
MSRHCTLVADDEFGPVVSSCRDNFDFTLLFEQSIFAVVPSAILLLSCAWRLLVLRKEDVKLSVSSRVGLFSRVLKQFAAASLASIQLALLIYWSISSTRTQASIVSTALSFLASLALIFLTSIEHARSVRPSTIICIYLSFDILLSLPQCRTLWLRNQKGIGSVFTIGLVIEVIMLWLESRGKRRFLRNPYRLYPPEVLGGIWNRITLWWLNPLFRKGSSTLLTFKTLYNIDNKLSANDVYLKFQRAWESRPLPHSKNSLLLATWECFRSPLMLMGFPRLLLIGFKFAQPLLILRVTSFLSDSSGDKNSAYGLIGAAGLIYLGLAVSPTPLFFVLLLTQ